MANQLDSVPVLVGHLQNLERVLETAQGLVAAEDLARQFRQMSGRPQSSNLARALEEQLDRIRGYLDDAEVDEVPDDDS